MTLFADAVRRRRPRPGAASALGSLLVHGVVVAISAGVAASAPNMDQFISYNIELVSMPGPHAFT